MISAGRGTWFGLEIGRTGLSTAQFGLDVTGHNIANVDTPGYTRQRIVQTAYDPYAAIGRFAPVSAGLIGEGTRIKILDQIRSDYLDRRFRTEVTAHEYWSTRTQSLTYVQSFFDNVNEQTSINTTMAAFFGAMNTQSTDSVSQAARKLVQTTGMDLVQQLQMIYDGLIDLQRSENTAVKTVVSDINRITKDITDLNKKIYEFEVTGMIANDLRDKRNLLVDQLSELIDIEYEEYHDVYTDSDMFRIKLLCSPGRINDPQGITLVDHTYSAELGAFAPPGTKAGEEPMWEVHWVAGYTREGTPIPGDLLDFSKITGGKLKAHLDVRDGNEFRAAGIFASQDNNRITWMNEDGDEFKWNPDFTGNYGTGAWVLWDKVKGGWDNDKYIEWSGTAYEAYIDGRPPIDPKDLDIRHINYGEYGYIQTNDSRYRGIPYYMEMLNDLARALIKEVNEVHRQGWGDHPLGSKTGINFFNEEPEWVKWVDEAGNEFKWDDSIAFSFTDSVTGEVYNITGGWTAGTGIITRHPRTGEYVDAGGTPITFEDAAFDHNSPPLTVPPPGTIYRMLDLSQITVKDFDLSAEIKDNEWNIACSTIPIQRAGGDDELETQRGNNENIKELYKIFGRNDIFFDRPMYDNNGKMLLDSTGTPLMKRVDIGGFADYSTVIRFDLGNTLHTAKQTGETSRILRYAAENQRTSVAGVSLDEEMVGMVRYNHAYNGAARVITAMDDALDRLINGTGRVGL